MTINFIGLIMFYCPCLMLNIIKMNEGRNCFLFCYKHEHSHIHNRLSMKIDKNQQQQPASSETQKLTLNEKSSARIINECQEQEEAEMRVEMKSAFSKPSANSGSLDEQLVKSENTQLKVTSMSTLASSTSMSPSSSSTDSSLPSLTIRNEYKEITSESEITKRPAVNEIFNEKSNATLKLRSSESPESDAPVEGDQQTRPSLKRANVQSEENSSPVKKVKSSGLFGCLFANSHLMRYSILGLFVFYGVFNLLIIFKDMRTNIPLTDLIPKESFLNKHMRNHLDLFGIGPLIMVSFVKPVAYWDQKVRDQIYGFLNAAKELKGMNARFQMSWLDEIENRFKDFPEENCTTLYTKDCFCRAFESWTSGQVLIYGQDLSYKPVNCSQGFLEISASRFYLQFKEFKGVLPEYNLITSLKQLAEEQYNLTSDQLIIYSVVDLYLEQIGELLPTLASIILLSLEFIYLFSLIFMFDLRTTLLLSLVLFSLIASVMSCMTLLKVTFNIITLTNYLMLPAFMVEFFFHISYLFVVAKYTNVRTSRVPYRQRHIQDDQQVPNTRDQEAGNQEVPLDRTQPMEAPSMSSSSTSVVSPYIITAIREQENEECLLMPTNSPPPPPPLTTSTCPSSNVSHKERLKQLNFSFQKTSNMMIRYLVITLFSFLLCMLPCQTYSFRNLYLFILTALVNIILHLLVFFPNLLFLFGSSASSPSRAMRQTGRRKGSSSLPCK